LDAPFTTSLKKSGWSLEVPTDKSTAEVLQQRGLPVVTKCSGGLCVLSYTSAEVEHRDYVLSNKECETKIVTRRSRAKDEGGAVGVDL